MKIPDQTADVPEFKGYSWISRVKVIPDLPDYDNHFTNINKVSTLF